VFYAVEFVGCIDFAFVVHRTIVDEGTFFAVILTSFQLKEVCTIVAFFIVFATYAPGRMLRLVAGFKIVKEMLIQALGLLL